MGQVEILPRAFPAKPPSGQNNRKAPVLVPATVYLKLILTFPHLDCNKIEQDQCWRRAGAAPGNRALHPGTGRLSYSITMPRALPSGSGVAVGLRQRLPPRAWSSESAIARAPVVTVQSQRKSLCTDNPTSRAMRWRGGGRGSQPTAHSEVYHDEGAEREGSWCGHDATAI